MNIEELTNIFSYHAPVGDQEVRYDIIRSQAKSLAIHIEKWCPRSREKSLAITKLQECVMMANAAIAIHEKAEIAPDDRPTPSDGELPTLQEHQQFRDSLPDPPGHHEVSDEDRAAEQAEKEEEQEQAEERADVPVDRAGRPTVDADGDPIAVEDRVPPEVLNEAEDDEREQIEAQEEGL